MGMERIYQPPEKLHEVLGTAVRVNQISGFSSLMWPSLERAFLSLNSLEMFVNCDIQLCMCIVDIMVVDIVNDVLEIRVGI